MNEVRHRLKRSIRPAKLARFAAMGAGAALIFCLGVGIGDGRLQVDIFSKHASVNTALPAQLNYSSVTEVYKVLKDNYNGALTSSSLLDGLKQGLAEATNDPYTVYFNPQQAKTFQDQLNNSFSGIGAELGKDSDGNLIVVSPIKGFPADKAGLKPQDVIAEIDGLSTIGLKPDLAVGKIRGPKGTKVTLKIVRAKSQALTFTITRDDIRIPSVTSKTLPGNIGYVAISTFADDTGSLARQAAVSFKQAGVKGIVLDLRGNPGGLLTSAIDVSSLWLPAGKTIVTEKGTNGVNTSSATGDDPLNSVPTVVLLDEGSASASEITAAALHDNSEARLIGEKSFGKGVVQQLIDLGDGSQLKVTVASWYRPDGDSIQKKGITPDQTVPLSDEDAKAGNDTQLTTAETYLSNL